MVEQDWIDDSGIDRVVQLTRDLISVPSVNPFGGSGLEGTGEAAVAEVYADELSNVGMDVSIVDAAPGRPSLVARLRGTSPGPTLMLAGHLDTVGVKGYTDPFNPRIDGNRIHGRGSCDMKGALAAFVEVARAMGDTAGFAGELLIAGTADEEDLMIGSAAFVSLGYSPDFCVVGEPTGLSICPAHKGQLASSIRTFGRAVHSSVPDEGINAIVKMARVIEVLADYNSELSTRPAHAMCGHGTLCIGVISGGDIVSAVPDFCEIVVDRRTLPGESPEDAISDYRIRLAEIAATDPDFRHEVTGPTMVNEPLDTPVEHRVVRAAVEAHHAVTGDNATVTAFTGSTDAPNFRCPSIIYGPGSLSQAHSTDEWVDIDELVVATRVYLEMARRLLQPSA